MGSCSSTSLGVGIWCSSYRVMVNTALICEWHWIQNQGQRFDFVSLPLSTLGEEDKWIKRRWMVLVLLEGVSLKDFRMSLHSHSSTHRPPFPPNTEFPYSGIPYMRVITAFMKYWSSELHTERGREKARDAGRQKKREVVGYSFLIAFVMQPLTTTLPFSPHPPKTLI